IEDFIFIEEIFEVCLRAQESGYMIFVVTNQGGIARGYYKVSDFEKLTSWMEAKFRLRGITINKTYFCPFFEEGSVEEYAKASFDRKPNPGMILRAEAEFDLDLSQSLLIGDSARDIAAARNAKLKESYLMVQNEQGVVFYRNGDYDSQRSLFEMVHSL
ncbi:MAG: HAD-IIIA family hydrolase, partial [Rickettsiales bacterium]|nr:HAD-IIIA family hydrolase [Rickettsiales bacterium]